LSEAGEDLLRALRELAVDPGIRLPEWRHGRRLTVALGEAALAAEEELPAALLENVRALFGERADAWCRAIARDLELAVWEFDTSVDSRHLDRADYDHDYTREARLQIESRLAAWDLLDMEIPEQRLLILAAADRRYAPHEGLEKH